MYFQTVNMPYSGVPNVIQSKRNFIKDFQDSEVKIYYTFNSVDDLTHLYQLLKFPNKVIFDNRSIYKRTLRTRKWRKSRKNLYECVWPRM